MTKAHCKAKRADGQPCRMAPGKDGYCFNHSASMAKKRAQARKRGGQARLTPHAGDPYTLPADIVSLGDARKILDFVLAEVLPMQNTIPRARALLAVYEQYVKSFEIGEIEQRLAALEAALNVRQA